MCFCFANVRASVCEKEKEEAIAYIAYGFDVNALNFKKRTNDMAMCKNSYREKLKATHTNTLTHKHIHIYVLRDVCRR